MADLANMNNYRDEWGQVTNYNNAGKFELVEVRSVPNATTINLICGLKHSYTASGRVQVVRVPRFIDLTVNTGCSVIAIPTSITLSATGGNGGNQVLSFGSFATPLEASGPGGGGTGGGIAFSLGTPTQNATGGLSGITNSSKVNTFPPNGATSGAAGMTSLPFEYFTINAANVTICANNSTTLNGSVIGSLPSGAVLTWYSTQFGSTVLGTGATYTTPVLSATTTYF
jgi:hypothetical protein